MSLSISSFGAPLLCGALALLPPSAATTGGICPTSLSAEHLQTERLAADLLDGRLFLGAASEGQEYIVSSTVDASVEKVLVHEGEPVSSGDTAIWLTSPELVSTAAQALAREQEMRAEVARTLATQRRARSEAQRRANFPDLFSREERDAYQEAAKAADAEHEKSQAALKQVIAERAIADGQRNALILRIPMTAMVQDLHVVPGQAVRRGDTLLKLRVPGPMEVRFLLPKRGQRQAPSLVKLCVYAMGGALVGQINHPRVDDTFNRSLDGFVGEGSLTTLSTNSLRHGESLWLLPAGEAIH